MDYTADYVVSFSMTFPKGILVSFDDVPDGLLAESILKSTESELYWKVDCRYLERPETGFDGETIEPIHLNRGLGIPEKPDGIWFDYRLQPIGHSEIPKEREILRLHKTSCVHPCLILAVYDDFVLVEKGEGQTGLLARKKFHIYKNHIRPGHYARYCEHGMHDLVDTEGNFIRFR